MEENMDAEERAEFLRRHIPPELLAPSAPSRPPEDVPSVPGMPFSPMSPAPGDITPPEVLRAQEGEDW